MMVTPTPSKKTFILLIKLIFVHPDMCMEHGVRNILIHTHHLYMRPLEPVIILPLDVLGVGPLKVLGHWEWVARNPVLKAI